MSPRKQPQKPRSQTCEPKLLSRITSDLGLGGGKMQRWCPPAFAVSGETCRPSVLRCVLNSKPAPKTTAFETCRQASFTDRALISAAAAAAAVAMVSLQEPLGAVSSFSIAFWVLWLSELDVLGACLSGGNLKSWGTRHGTQTLRSSGSSSELSVPAGLCFPVLGRGT